MGAATSRRPAAGATPRPTSTGKKRSNETHASTTDPDARLYRKGPGKEAKLCFIGHGLMENRSGLLVDACLTPADGHAERVAALHMIEPHADRPRAITLGADKGYDAADFVNELRSMNVTPHVAQNTSNRRSAIDGRTTRHGGYARQPAHPQAHRGSVRLDQDGGRAGEDQVPRRRPRRLRLHLRRRGLQSRPTAQAAGGGRLMGKVPVFAKAFADRWRIVEMDVWDNDVLDEVAEAHITFEGRAPTARSPSPPLAATSMSATASRDGRPAQSSLGKAPTIQPLCGRGWVTLGTAGRLVGHFYIHKGDNSPRNAPDFFNSLLVLLCHKLTIG